MLFAVVERQKLLFDKFVKIAHNRIFFRFQIVKIGGIVDVKSCVQLHQHDLYGIDLSVAEVLVGSEKVL